MSVRYTREQTLSGATPTWNVKKYFFAEIAASANVAITLTIDNRQGGVLYFTQDSTGGRTLSISGTNVHVNAAASSLTIVQISYAFNTLGITSNYYIAPTQLSTPTLTATVASSTQIDLSWTNVSNETSYKLEYSLDGSTGWTQIGGTLAANTTTYSHTGLTASTAYYYRVSAIGDGINYSNSGYGTDNDTTSSAGYPAALIMYHKFEEASGNFLDSTTNTRDLTRVNGVTTGTGKITSGALMDSASSQYLTAAALPALNTNGFSCELFFKMNTTAAAYQIVVNAGKLASGNFLFNVFYDKANSILKLQGSSDGSTVGASISLSFTSDGNWHFLQAGYVSGFLMVKLDGGSYQYTTLATLHNGTPTLVIGSDTDGTYSLDGGVDILRFYNASRSEAQVTANYNSGNGLQD